MARATDSSPLSDHSLANAPVGSGRRQVVDAHGGADDKAERVFSTSILISATRCTLTYVVLPWVAPAIGVASDVGPLLGLVIGVVAILFNVLSIRRFVMSDHKWKRPLVALNSSIILLLAILMVNDLRDLLG
ncbi:MAG: hypothetical protein R2770_05045 [Acidimicrobiales bacterium]